MAESWEGSQRQQGTQGRREGQSIAAQAKEVATHLGEQARELVSDRVASRQSRSALELNGIADALRQKGEQMEGSMLAPFVSSAAEKMDQASSYLMDARPADVVRATERFARKDPVLFLGGAFALGVLCARFFKSSAQRGAEAQPEARP
jgi:hypothetical protein